MCNVRLMALIMRDLWLGASRHGTGLVCPAQGEGCNHLCGLQASSGRVSRANEIREDTSHVAPCEGGEIHAFVRIQLTKTLFWLLSMVNLGQQVFSVSLVCVALPLGWMWLQDPLQGVSKTPHFPSSCVAGYPALTEKQVIHPCLSYRKLPGSRVTGHGWTGSCRSLDLI